jgi:cytochrome P450
VGDDARIVPARTRPVPAFTRSGPAGEWIARRYADVRAVLADGRFEVPTAGPAGPPGTVAWLRASVSRFANGPEHLRRRALAVAELSRLDPTALQADAGRRTRAALTAAGGPGDRIDVMGLIARPVPLAAMAAALGAADPVAAAAAAAQAARGYFPGADERAARLADGATAHLTGLLGPAEPDTVVARMALLIQGCDATAGLIGTALHVLQDAPGGAAGWPTGGLLAEVLRHSPPVRASRRVAAAAAQVGGQHVGAGDAVVCSVEEANRDPAVFERPGEFDPARPQPPGLTFGYGVRPCPGEAQALLLAAGVVDAVRERARLLPGQPVEYEPNPALRIPLRLEVELTS